MWFEKSEQWVQQSQLLLQARPSTTRVTTKYHIDDPSKKSKKQRSAPAKREALSTDEAAAKPPSGPRAILVLKTFDTASGACLKYQTNKAAEVGRLFAALGGLGRAMAALPDLPEDSAALDATIPDRGTGTSTPVPEGAKGATDTKNTQGTAGGGGGGKKKKKGKK